MAIEVTTRVGRKTYKGGLGFAALGNELSEEFIEDYRKFTISVAKDVIKEEVADGFSKDYLTLVDNRKGKNESEMVAFGKIEYIANTPYKEIIDFAWKELSRKSPRDTGTYSRHHLLLFQGKEIASSIFQFDSWYESNSEKVDTGDVFRFVNVMPYAGMLEREGITSGGTSLKIGLSEDQRGKRAGFQVRKPNGVYKLTYNLLRSKFKKTSKIDFEMIPGDYIGQANPKRNPSNQFRGNRVPWRNNYSPDNRYNAGFYVYPSFTIKV